MKKLFLALLLPLFFSCGDDDNNNGNDTPSCREIEEWLIGVWIEENDIPSWYESTLYVFKEGNYYQRCLQRGELNSGKEEIRCFDSGTYEVLPDGKIKFEYGYSPDVSNGFSMPNKNEFYIHEITKFVPYTGELEF